MINHLIYVKIRIMKIIHVLFVIILLDISFVWAAPATELKLGYDLDKHILSINAKHPVDRERHHIQKVIVLKNLLEKKEYSFSHQTRADRFIEDIDYKAISTDHLDVELYCSQGGETKGSIDITSPIPMKKIIEQNRL